MKLHFHSYRFAAEVLASPAFSQAYGELVQAFQDLPPVRRGSAPWSKKKPHPTFPVDQDGMNRWLDDRFQQLNWIHHPRITSGTKLEGDYRKDRIQIECQFGNMARWTYDILKFQICYSQDDIDVGVLVVPMQWFAKLIGDNIAYFQRVCRELPHAKLSITLPILVIGLDPQDDPDLAPKMAAAQAAAEADEAANGTNEGITL